MDPLSLIRSFEGFRETPYWDVNALRTGYGSDTVTLPDGSVKRVTEGTRVTREDADRDLARRVNSEFIPRAASAVGEEVFASLPENQKAALASITYNYGELPSVVAKAVRSGNPQAVASAIRSLGSHNGGINKDRRNKEAEVFLGGGSIQGGGADAGQAANPVEKPVERNPLRLAWAYRNGKMSPEDAALYEQGLRSGAFRQEQKPEPLPGYQVIQPRKILAPVDLSIGMAPQRPGLRGYS